MTGVEIPGVELSVVNDAGRLVPRDGATIGEIVVQSDVVMAGYWNRPDETGAAIRDGWFHTGDMAVWHPNRYVVIVDRRKDIIISGGENISSIEIENALYEHPAVLEAVVVPAPDEHWVMYPVRLSSFGPMPVLSKRTSSRTVAGASPVSSCHVRSTSWPRCRKAAPGRS